MATSNLKVRFGMEPVKWLLGASITANYVALADVTGNTLIVHPGRQILIQNATDGDVMISLDGITDHVPIFMGSFILLDISSNKEDPSGAFDMAKGTTIYATQIDGAGGGGLPFAGLFSDPTTGALFASLMYGQ